MKRILKQFFQRDAHPFVQFIKYGVCGGAATAVDMAIFFLFAWLVFPALRESDPFAKLLYLAPTTELTHPGLPPLIEHLSAEAGQWGAFHVIAEVDETSDAFPALRAAGFAVYAWQRLWDVSGVAAPGSFPCNL